MQENNKIIFLADDDLEDVELLQEAVASLEAGVIIQPFSSGKAIVTYLKEHAEKDPPALILLDYNMPDMNGAQVLHLMSAIPAIASITKAVWSTSNAQDYVKECLNNGACHYFVKPSSSRELTVLAKKILDLSNKSAT